MSITSEADWKGLCEVGRIVRLALDALERHAQAGVSTAELDQVARQILANHGARSAPAMVYGFPGTVLICVNDEVVHGVPGSRRLKPGDVVKLDVTVEKGGYMAGRCANGSCGQCFTACSAARGLCSLGFRAGAQSG